MSSLLWNFPSPDPLANLPANLPALPEPESGRKDLPSLPSNTLSPWYHSYPDVIDDSNNAFDFHIYYSKGPQMEHAKKLHEAIRREFPEIRVYKFWEIPVGPHPVPMFEVNTFTPAQFGALFGFLVVFRGGLSVLIHPNTDDAFRDHTDRATWMGERWPLVEIDGLAAGKSLAEVRAKTKAAADPAPEA